jgi:hypothetical protein
MREVMGIEYHPGNMNREGRVSMSRLWNILCMQERKKVLPKDKVITL